MESQIVQGKSLCIRYCIVWILKVCTPNSTFTSKKMPFYWSALFRRVSLDLNRFHRSKKYVGALDQVLPLHHRSVAPGGPSGGARARQGGWPLACRMPTPASWASQNIENHDFLVENFDFFDFSKFIPTSIPRIARLSGHLEMMFSDSLAPRQVHLCPLKA